MDEENLEKKDLKCVRQSMYSERRKLHPAQPKNQAEFHSILDDIGVVTKKDDDNKFITMAQMNVYFIGANDTHGLHK